jgi:hypothetical protein
MESNNLSSNSYSIVATNTELMDGQLTTSKRSASDIDMGKPLVTDSWESVQEVRV